MVGPKYGDFHLKRHWTSANVKILEVTQGRGTACRLPVREFVPPKNSGDLDLKGRPMYYCPWSIEDPEAAVQSINAFITVSVSSYINSIVDQSDSLIWTVFQLALEESQRDRLLKETLRLWVVSRFIESGWKVSGNDKLNSQDVPDPYRPGDWVSPPPYIDFQMASLFMHRILSPLRKNILNELQNRANTKKTQSWYSIFLTSFVLLHNYELGVAFQTGFAARRQVLVREEIIVCSALSDILQGALARYGAHPRYTIRIKDDSRALSFPLQGSHTFRTRL
jgi:hypothetical protein